MGDYRKFKTAVDRKVRLLQRAGMILLTPTLIGCQLIPHKEEVAGKAWKITGEKEDFPERNIPELVGKSDFGICFSGGGNRSAVATLGQLRALRASGILQKARYVSAVSGGAWGSAPWVFLSDTSDENDARFLGELVMPRDLQVADFPDEPDPESFAAAAIDSGMSLMRAVGRLDGDENFGAELAGIYLQRQGINDPERVPVYGQRGLAEMLAQNPSLQAKDFLVCREGRPFFIAGSAISRRDHSIFKPKDSYIPFEFTTSYSGARCLSERSTSPWKRRAAVGGGYVQNLIYDGRFNTARPGTTDMSVRVSKATPFPRIGSSSRLSLGDMLAASGSAPTSVAPFLSDALGFPEFRHYSPAALPTGKTPELLHTDGGAVENLGIMPLLARGVRNILVFSNTEAAYCAGMLPKDIGYLFAQAPNPRTGLFSKRLNRRAQQLAEMNFVLDDPGSGKRSEMVRGFDRALEDGSTLIHHGRYRVRDNVAYGIKGGWEVNISWIVLGPCGTICDPINPAVKSTLTLDRLNWYREIKDPQVKRMLMSPELKNFPHYETFGRSAFARLSPLKVHALAHFTSYSVAANSKALAGHLRLRFGPLDCLQR